MNDTCFYINGRFLTQKITGVQRNAYELTKNLLLLDCKAIVLVPNHSINPDYDVSNWPIEKMGKSAGLLWEQMDLPIYLKLKKSPLLVNLTNTAPVFYTNQIVSIMDMTTFINPEWFTKKFVIYYHWLIPKIIKKSKKVLTISECSKNDIIKFTGTKQDKIKIVYCGISKIFSSNQNAVQEVPELFKRIGISKGGYLLAVSSLDPRKNFKNLIESYLEIDTKIPLVIVGSQGKVFNKLHITLAEGDAHRIIFTGYVEDADLVQLYKSSLCFIYPSFYEGFGIPPLEAMACGCPTIVSNTSSLPEVCGDASLFVEPDNLQSIENAINLIIADNAVRNGLIEKGFENVKRFNWQNSAKEVLKEIHTLI